MVNVTEVDSPEVKRVPAYCYNASFERIAVGRTDGLLNIIEMDFKT
jgi:hypothetical protein